jgi:hypothetical protein
MQLTSERARLDLADDEVARLRDACDARLDVVQGFVWLTIDGDRQDVILGPGDSYVVDTADTVFLSALRGRAAVTVRARGAAAACTQARADGRPTAAEMRRAARPGRLRELLTSVSISSVAIA